MKRFLLLVSGFLFVGFYQLSGGADFDPVAAREAAVLARMEDDAARRDAAPATMIAMLKNTSRQPSIAPEMPAAEQETVFAAEASEVQVVTRAAVDLSLLTPAEPDVRTAPEPAPAVLAEEAAPIEIKAAFQSVEDLAAASETPIPSLIFPGATTAAASVGTPDARDLRFIDGDRVNMRSGPGTGYEVVDQFGRNTAVEVLEDSGTGWVRLRPAEGGPDGWIADFLLTGG